MRPPPPQLLTEGREGGQASQGLLPKVLGERLEGGVGNRNGGALWPLKHQDQGGSAALLCVSGTTQLRKGGGGHAG